MMTAARAPDYNAKRKNDSGYDERTAMSLVGEAAKDRCRMLHSQ